MGKSLLGETEGIACGFETEGASGTGAAPWEQAPETWVAWFVTQPAVDADVVAGTGDLVCVVEITGAGIATHGGTVAGGLGSGAAFGSVVAASKVTRTDDPGPWPTEVLGRAPKATGGPESGVAPKAGVLVQMWADDFSDRETGLAWAASEMVEESVREAVIGVGGRRWAARVVGVAFLGATGVCVGATGVTGSGGLKLVAIGAGAAPWETRLSGFRGPTAGALLLGPASRGFLFSGTHRYVRETLGCFMWSERISWDHLYLASPLIVRTSPRLCGVRTSLPRLLQVTVVSPNRPTTATMGP